MYQELSIYVRAGDHVAHCIEEANIVSLLSGRLVIFEHMGKTYLVAPDEAEHNITPKYIAREIESLCSNFIDTVDDIAEEGKFYSSLESEIADDFDEEAKSARWELTKWQLIRNFAWPKEANEITQQSLLKIRQV